MVVQMLRAAFSHIARRLSSDQVSARKNSESGDTLVEILIALLVVALTATALLGAFATSISASGKQRGLATNDTVLKSYVESAIFQIQNQPFNAALNTFPIFAGCGTASATYYTSGIATGLGANGVTLYSPPTGYTASISTVQFWDPAPSPPGSPPAWMDISSCSAGSSTSLNPQQLTATVTAPNGTTASLQFVVSNPHVPAGSPSQIVVSTQPPSTSVTAGGSFGVAFAIEDSLGHVLNSTATVSLGITPGTGTTGAALTCPAGKSIAAVSGIASFSCSIDLVGAGYTLTATSPGLSAANTNSLTVIPGAPNRLAFTPDPPGGGAASAGSPIPSVSVQVLDSQGNLVTTATGSVAMSIGAGSAQPSFDTGSTTSVTLNSGIAAFAGLQVTAPGTYTFVATPAGIAGLSSPVTSASFSVAPGPSTLQLVFTTPPGGGPNGQVWSAQPVVAIENGLGVTQTGNTTSITISISSHPGTVQPLSCPVFGTTLVPTNGVASFAGCFIIGTAGTTYQLTATAAAGSGIVSAVSAPFTISVGAPFQLQFNTPPGGAKKSKPLSPEPVLSIQDSGGNLTNSTATVTATLTANGGHSGAVLTCPPVNGVSGTATFAGCSINQAGSGYAITFTSPGLQSVTSGSLTIAN